MTKPRVTIVHYSAPPEVGGVEVVLAEHTRILLAAGYRVTLLVGRGGSDPIFARARVGVIPELDSQYPDNLAIGAAIACGVVPPEFEGLAVRIQNALEQPWLDSDIVIVHNMLNTHYNLPATAALYRLARDNPARVIAWCHDVSRFVRAGSEFPPHFGYPWDLLRTFRPEITYIAVSHARQKMLARTFAVPAERIHVILNGVDPAALLGLSLEGQRLVSAFHLLESDVSVLMPVRITRVKNIDFALRVMAELVTQDLQPRLVVTGPADPHDADGVSYFKNLVQLRGELGLQEQVHFVYEGSEGLPRFIDGGVVAELYRVSDLVLMPSLREGFGLPIFEGGLSGKPVFVTAMPAVAEIGEELVYLIRADESPVQVAARIKVWVETDPTQRLRRKVRQQYTWPAVFSQEIEPLLAELAQPEEVLP